MGRIVIIAGWVTTGVFHPSHPQKSGNKAHQEYTQAGNGARGNCLQNPAGGVVITVGLGGCGVWWVGPWEGWQVMGKGLSWGSKAGRQPTPCFGSLAKNVCPPGPGK